MSFSKLFKQCLHNNNRSLYLLTLHTFTAGDIHYALKRLIKIVPPHKFYSQALFLRAWMHGQGLGGPKDKNKEIELYEEAIALGNSNAMCNLALIYMRNIHGPINYPKAVALLEKAIAQNNVFAMNNLANLYSTGTYGSFNYQKAIVLLERAIAMRDPHAMNNRAKMHESGLGGPVNYQKAIILYEQAIALGSRAALFNRAQMYDLEKNYLKAKVLYEQAIALKDGTAMINLALIYQEGKGVPVDYEKAKALLNQAIDLKVGDAMAYRGYMYQMGMGSAIDYEKAKALYEQAIKQGTNSGMLFRAMMHHDGKGGEVNYKEAINLSEQAIKLRHSPAMNFRAKMHTYGVGGPVNYEKAIELFEQAITLGNVVALNNLAWMHQEGRGCLKNVNKASQLYYQAYRSGYSQALDKLKKHSEKNNSFAKAYLILIYLKDNHFDKANSFYIDETYPILIEELLKQIDKFPEYLEFTQALLNFVREKNEDFEFPPKHYLSVKSLIHENNEIKALEVCLEDFSIIDYLTAKEIYCLANVILNDDVLEEELPTARTQRMLMACWLYYQAYSKGDIDLYPMLIQLLAAYTNASAKMRPSHQISAKNAQEQALIDQLKRDYLTKSCFEQEIKSLNTLLATKSSQFNTEEQELIKIARRKLSYGISLKECLNSSAFEPLFSKEKQGEMINPGIYGGLFQPRPKPGADIKPRNELIP